MGAAGASGPATFVEDVFSTYLYKGNSSTQSINNGIDLSGKGGLVWLKVRTSPVSGDHNLYDTNRGARNYIISNQPSPQATAGTGSGLTAFTSNGFSLGSSWNNENRSDSTYASWTFRKQPKFFDIVTWTGDGTSDRNIAHNLGAIPGAILVKRTDASANWVTLIDYDPTVPGAYAIGGPGYTLALNTTNANYTNIAKTTVASSTQINVAKMYYATYPTLDASATNTNGATYVAYLFADNAGGFGLSGAENVISCGIYTGSGSVGNTVTLGYEPQWILIKPLGEPGNWVIVDNMRGMSQTNSQLLNANTSAAETALNPGVVPTATGFVLNTTNSNINGGGANPYSYIAIRRPMKTPTTGTEVFSPVARTGTGATATINNIGFAPDFFIPEDRTGQYGATSWDRLRGGSQRLRIFNTEAEFTLTGADIVVQEFGNNSIRIGNNGAANESGKAYANWFFRRASGFFDEVCYKGSNGYQDLSHNLGVIPQMVIIKNRINSANWIVGLRGITGAGKYLILNSTSAIVSDANYFGGDWTSTYVQIDGNILPMNQNSSNYVMYLFASVANVSKVFSFTGNGSSQTINCSFTTGARFILIKRTDSTGDWYVWDSARGIVSGNDPHLSLNTTAAEVTTDDTIDPDSTGFIVNQVAATNVNVNAATYIGIAIA
jgi:hypothetical protein